MSVGDEIAVGYKLVPLTKTSVPERADRKGDISCEDSQGNEQDGWKEEAMYGRDIKIREARMVSIWQ